MAIHAVSTRQLRKIVKADSEATLWNLMWPALGIPKGTFYFNNQPDVPNPRGRTRKQIGVR